MSSTSYNFSASMLQPVSSLIQRYGVKAIIYGGPGTGKTPMITTAPYPVHCFSEPGMLSIRSYQGPGYIADTYAKMRDFVLWATLSNEAKQFQTKCFDSLSQMCQIILDEEKKVNKDGRKAYGIMGDKIMEMMNWLFFAQDCNVVLLAKETLLEIEGMGKKYRPMFPGQQLDAQIPHLFDSIWRLEYAPDGKGGTQRVIRTKENFQAFARDRSGNLAELEHADLTYLLNKARQ